MRAILVSIAAFGAASCATYDDREPGPMGPELTEAVAGRVAGEPQSCVSLRDLDGNRSVDNGDAIIFDGRGGVIYVNRPPAGCPSLRFGRTLVTVTPSTQLCRGEIANVVDLTSNFSHGSCGLGDFVPYRRVRD